MSFNSIHRMSASSLISTMPGSVAAQLPYNLKQIRRENSGFKGKDEISLGGIKCSTTEINNTLKSIMGDKSQCLLHASNSNSLEALCSEGGALLSAKELHDNGIEIKSGEFARLNTDKYGYGGSPLLENSVFTFPHDITIAIDDMTCFDGRCLEHYADCDKAPGSFPVIYVIDPEGCERGEVVSCFGSILPEFPVKDRISSEKIWGVLVPGQYVNDVRVKLSEIKPPVGITVLSFDNGSN